MATFTDRQRTRAYEMFSDGFTSAQVARRLRLEEGSIRALKAHWTMSGSPASTTRRAVRRTTGSSSNSSNTVINLSRAQARRVARAYENGQQVSLTIGS